MPRLYKARAKVTAYYHAYVQVPDDWTAEDVAEWYEYNGASGEFVTDDATETWDWLWPIECKDARKPDMIFTERVTEVNGDTVLILEAYPTNTDENETSEGRTDWLWQDSGVESDGFVTVHPKV